MNLTSVDQQLLANLFKAQPDGILLCDRRGLIHYCNPSFQSLYSLSFNEIRGQNILTLIPELTESGEHILLNKAIREKKQQLGGIQSLQLGTLTDGKKFQWCFSPTLNSDDDVTGLICTLRDVTQQEFNKESGLEHLMQKITVNLPGVVYEYLVNTDGTGSFTYISPKVSELLKLRPRQIIEDPFLLESLIHKDDRNSFVESSRKSNESITSWKWEGRIVVDDEIKWIEAKSSAELQRNGTVLRYGIILDITERKIIERQRVEIEQRLELGLKGADLGLWDYSFKDRKAYISERWANILGYTREELEAHYQNWANFVHPEDIGYARAVVRAHIKGQTEFYEAVYRFKTKSGEWRWIMERGQVVERDADGRAIRSVGTLQDFHLRKLSEKVLKESEQRYRDLVESLPFGVVVHVDGRIQFVNQRLVKMLGYKSAEHLIGKNVLELVPAKFHSELLKRRERVMSGESTSLFEMQVYKSNKELLDIETTSIPFFFNEKPASQTMINDISEKRRVQDEIRKNEKLYTQLFQNAPIAVVLLDDQRRVMQANKGFEEVFGYKEEEIRNKTLNDLIVPVDRKTEGEELNKRIVKNEITKVETVRQTKSGKLVSVIIYGFPVMLDNKTIGIYGIYVDITARKQVEEELQIRNTELDNFVYKVSHDLRAPLSSILGLVNLANLESNDDDPRMYLQLIGKKVGQLDKFIGDVLSHSKNLKVEINIQDIDFTHLIHQAFSDLSYLNGADTVVKTIHVEGAKFRSDPWRISEIFRNLVSNAIKYRKLTEPETHININIQVSSVMATIEFSDSGIGISEDNLPKIFEMFYRAAEQSEGSGIGLYIVKNAVDKLGGSLDVKSKAGEGTTFIVSLPNNP